MAQVWNEGKPAMDNAISADIPDMEENLQFLSHWVKGRRSIFTYNGGTTAYTIKCKPAFYYCKDKVCWWDAELTTGAISGPAKDDWYYLYLDNSGITSGTEITNSELLWSATEPAWSDTYAGWYNGDDRCIFAVMSNSTPNNILEFFHDGGDFVLMANTDSLTSGATWANWTDVTVVMPKFATKALITGQEDWVDGAAYAYWRTNGQTGSTGHVFSKTSTDAKLGINTFIVITDSSQKFEGYGAGSNTYTMYAEGWYLPAGM